MEAVRLDKVYYRYPNSGWVLKDLTLSIPKGRILVTGDSGSGKSTLLRIITGIAERIYGGELKGRVEVLGRPVLVPQDFDAYILMETPRDELTYILENQGLDPVLIEMEVDRIARLTGVERVLDRRVTSLSMGERQRVAIASALAMKPDILLLDEPLAYVDPQSVSRILAALDKSGVETIIIAEHRIQYLRKWAKHVVLLGNGACIYSGPVDGVKGASIPQYMKALLLGAGWVEGVAKTRGCLV